MTMPDPPRYGTALSLAPWSWRTRLALWFCIAVATAMQVLPLSRALIEFDVARDLLAGFAILDGATWPRQGPQIAGLFHVGPWWFYLVAAVISVAGSLGQYSVIMGCLASVKFAVAAWVGARIGGPMLAMLVVAAAALPGLAAYQYLLVSHTNFVELFLWLTAAGCVALGTPRARQSKAMLTGLAFAAAVHAHPTAASALPLVLAAMAVAVGSGRLWLRVTPWFLLAGLATLVPVLQDIPAVLARLHDPSARGHYAPEPGDSLLSVLPLLRGLLWTEPAAIAATAFATGSHPPLLWRIAWIVLVGAGLLGAAATLVRRNDGRWRLTMATTLALVWMAAWCAVLVPGAPAYAAYATLPPLALLLALGWTFVARLTHRLLLPVLVAGALSLQGATALSLIASIATGWVTISIVATGGVKQGSRQPRVEPYITVHDLDQQAREACKLAQPPALNGPGIVAVDASNGYAHRFAGGTACRSKVRFGAGEQVDALLPLAVAQKMGLDTAQRRGALVIAHPDRVVLPATPTALSDSTTYPVRIDDWRANSVAPAWTVEFSSAASDWVVLAPISALGWRAEATANGTPSAPVFASPGFSAYRCDRCQEPVQWRIRADGVQPRLMNVVTIAGRRVPGPP